MKTRSMISFDWAMKRQLRNKANFGILEGFLSELLRRDVIIKYIGESDSNKTDVKDKFNKVDLFVEADNKELIIIELQFDSEVDYFQRMLYGVSKSITEHIHESEEYSTIRKVYSVNIVYFDLGIGDDYIYHGITAFKGLHTNQELYLTSKQHSLYGKTVADDLFPEYYIIKVKEFNNVAKNTLDEWIYYLKNNKIRDDFTAKGLDLAREVLYFDNLTEEEKRDYLYDVEAKRIRKSEMKTAFYEGEEKGEATGLKKGEAIGLEKGEAIGLEKGKLEGEAIGLEKGETNANKKTVANCMKAGYSIDMMSTVTGLTVEEVVEIIEIIKKEKNEF